MDWWPWRRRRRRRRGGSGLLVYAAGTPGPSTLRDRLLARYRLWHARRKSRAHTRARRRRYDLPRFYRRAKPTDVQGLVVTGKSWTVGDFLPVGFEACVRLPNPFWKIVAKDTAGALVHPADGGDRREDTWATPVPCSEVAAANGLRMTHDAGWPEICGPHDRHLAARPDQAWSWAPRECDLDPLMAERLFRLLARETDPRDRCLAGQWEGGSDWTTRVLLVTRGWNYFVWRAPFRDVAAWLQQPDSFERDLHVPHVLWPADRRWFLATLYSGHSNYLAGARTLIDTVRASELEAYEVALTDGAH